MATRRIFCTLLIFVAGVAHSQTFDSQFGAVAQPGQFRSVGSVDDDASGNIYISDDATSRISKFTSSGTFILSWGTVGSGDGQFGNVSAQLGDVRVAPNGNVYVADRGNHRIQIFSSSGSFISKWGSAGTGDGQFSDFFTMAIDAAGNVYTLDGPNPRVQKFTANGVYVTQWGSAGSSDGQFLGPYGIGVDPNGDVYTVEIGGARIQKFTNTGTFITKWGTNGSNDGQFVLPTNIAFSGSNVYVTDVGLSRIQIFSNTGTFISKWAVAPGPFSTVGSLNCIEADVNGNILVGNGLEMDRFSPGGVLQNKFKSTVSDGEFSSPTRMMFDASDIMYVHDAFRVQRFNQSYNFIGILAAVNDVNNFTGGPGIGAIDAGGNIYVSDGRKVRKFDNHASSPVDWGAFGTGPQQIGAVADLAIDASGNVYVLDTYNEPHIKKFSSAGTFITSWGPTGTSNGQFSFPRRIAIDATNSVFVSDDSGRIQKFDQAGVFVTTWGSTGTGNGQFDHPDCLLIDNDGNVLVLDGGNQRIQKFTTGGTFITKWDRASLSTNLGSMNGLAMNSDGSLFVSDARNQRIAKFTFQNTISSFTPTSGAVGTTVVVTGTNFSKTVGNNIVKFNGTLAVATNSTPTTLTVKVPNGATTGNITVTVAGQTATSPSAFDVPVTTGLEGSANQFSTYPNPFSHSVTLELSQDQRNAEAPSIEIFNSLGVLIPSSMLVSQDARHWIWDGSGQSTGFYFVRVAIGGRVFTSKILKK